MRPRKKVRSDGPVRVGPTVTPMRVEICQLCNRRHLSECWRTTGACLRCGSIEHRVKDCPLRANEMQATVNKTTHLPRVVQQPPMGQGLARGGNGMGQEQKHRAESIGVSKLFKDVLLGVQGTVFLVDLIELLLGEFDIILGMDWLVKHRVSLDSEKLVRKGCKAYLAYISVSDFVDSSVKDIRTIRDFPNVFPEELLGLPPSREVEFGIELIPGTAPVSIAPYGMAPKKLTELKADKS
ncbi:uncharacterized protein [Gossypium hirsutum]|uniref:CCHC-type domain-containing protein n=1 Tax=Gossypium hirsutum TaxID=3635 RepID=A0A1U8M4R4_GOSHI|nr:uncharacterized protein LOC107933991 [Gossypium hirsutum]